MYGIDVSNWQAGLNLKDLHAVQFCIFKATEGLNFVDPSFNDFSNQCQTLQIPFGFYHFASTNEPEAEAEFFKDCVADLIGYGLPVLDYEISNRNNVEWVERFCYWFNYLTGMYPIIYMSASMCAQFKGSWVADTCKLWVAGYPVDYDYWTNDQMPYNVSPWNSCIIWQCTSNLHTTGYSGRLDGDISYIDKDEWQELCEGEIMTDETIQKIAAACASYVWQGSSYDVENNLNMYNCAHWTYEQVLKLTAEVMAMQETVKILANAIGNNTGIDSQQIIKAVSDAVTKRLKELKIKVE